VIVERCSIIGVGELLWDLLPDGPRLGGAPFNATAHLRRFGCEAAYVSAVGRDELGERAIEAVRELRVSDSLIETNERPTGVVRVALDNRGGPEFEIVSPAAYEALEPWPTMPSIGPEIDLIVFGTLAQRFPGVRARTQQVVGAAPAASRLYDVNLRVRCWDPPLVADLLELATVVKLNEEELATLGEALDLPVTSIERFARTASERFGLRALCVTRGGAGAALLLDGGYLEAPAPRVDVVDTVGAGDAFTAALAFGLVRSWGASEILRVANELGALVASRRGAIPDWDPSEIGITEPLD
jgi:fructokinase